MNIKVESWDDGRLVINRKFADLLKYNGIETAERLWSVRSDPVKNVVKERGTERIYMEPLKGTEYLEAYIKRYHHHPVRKRMQALVSFKKTMFDAFDEWDSILAFHRAGIPTMEPIAVARHAGKTCVLTLGISQFLRASDVFSGFVSTDFQLKRDLIGGLANIAAKMHRANMSHQDFYLVHFFITGKYFENIYIIDLQRVIKSQPLALRWRIKDLAQLLFSAREYVNRTDLLFFWRVYTNIIGPESYRDKNLIAAIFEKASRITRHDSNRRLRARQN